MKFKSILFFFLYSYPPAVLLLLWRAFYYQLIVVWVFSLLFGPPESGAMAWGRPALPPGQSQKECVRGHFHDPLRGPGCSQTSYPASGLLFELLWVLFDPGERGGAAFGSPTLPPQLNSGRGRRRPVPCPPKVSAAPTRFPLLVDCYVFVSWPFP